MRRYHASNVCFFLFSHGGGPHNHAWCWGPPQCEREETYTVYFLYVWSAPQCHICVLYCRERFPSILCFVLVCLLTWWLWVHLYMRERKHAWCIFSMYGAHLSVMHVLFTIGKDSLQSIISSLCALLTWRLWGPPSYEREEICTVYFLHIWSPFSVMYSLLLGKIPFNLSFCICMFYSHCICMWLLFLSFLLKIWTLILIFYTLQVLIFMEWLLHQRYAVVHVTSLLSQKRFFFFFGWESTKKSRS